MTLIEAIEKIKTGREKKPHKYFYASARRKSHPERELAVYRDDDYEEDTGGWIFVILGSYTPYENQYSPCFTYAELIATDWEVIF